MVAGGKGAGYIIRTNQTEAKPVSSGLMLCGICQRPLPSGLP